MAFLARRTASLLGLTLSLAVWSLLVPQKAVAEAEAVSKEYQIKAAFLYNFAKFVEWPAQSFPTAGGPIVIGVYCTDGFGAVLEKITRGRTIRGREIAVKTFTTALESTSAHMVYVCGEGGALWRQVMEVLQQNAVLTVADLGEAGTQDGMIVFMRVGDKVRFNINMGKAGQAGLKLSDQLQKLAISVTRTP